MDGELEKQLHDHDLRLTRVEVELAGVHKEIKEQRIEIRRNAEIAQDVQKAVLTLAEKISELTGSHKVLMWGIGVMGAAIASLEAWSVLGG